MYEEFKKHIFGSEYVPMPDTKKKQDESVTAKLNDYKKELSELYTKAAAAARAKKVDEYREMLKNGTLTDEERQKYTALVIAPEGIPFEALEVDYGENADRAAELATFIQHPEIIEEQSNQSEFIKRMEGYAERNAPKTDNK